MERSTIRAALLAGLLVLAACHDAEDTDGADGGPRDAAAAADARAPDAAPPPDGRPAEPETLQASGLYAGAGHEQLADGVRPFRPAYQLWSDGESKRRWLYLPPGTKIDTGGMDDWVFPVGTKAWKEFTRDGVRVETRMLHKTGPATWREVAYVWNQAQTAALAADGPVRDVLGTGHDVPSPADCRKCHDRAGEPVVGVSALLLDHAPGADLEDEVTLDSLAREGWLSAPPPGPASPHFPIPGPPVARDALGYLHVNCGGCHDPRSDLQHAFERPIVMRLQVGALATLEETSIYKTMVGVAAEHPGGGASVRITPCDPEHSAVAVRMSTRGATAMPPLGTRLVDDAGVGAVAAWIRSFPQCP